MDYDFLIGQQFIVGGRTFHAVGVAQDADGVWVRGVYRERGQGSIESFPIQEVIDALICDEEIELEMPKLRIV